MALGNARSKVVVRSARTTSRIHSCLDPSPIDVIVPKNEACNPLCMSGETLSIPSDTEQVSRLIDQSASARPTATDKRLGLTRLQVLATRVSLVGIAGGAASRPTASMDIHTHMCMEVHLRLMVPSGSFG